MDTEKLKDIARRMVARGKGILAIDESLGTIKKRFEAVGVEDTEVHRRAYRDLLITAPEGEKYLSGMILYDETIRQKDSNGTPFPAVLQKKGIIVGIKVDLGAKDMALHPGEKITEGLDGLRERLKEYRDRYGAEFAKWRAVIVIGEGIPTDTCIKANAHALARYAALCQEATIVPMVEPEVLIDGDHDINKSAQVSARTLTALFVELAEQGVFLPGVVLKTSMVLSGSAAKTQADVSEVARRTIECLKENVPEEIAGIVFLSGGQSDEKSTLHLNAMNALGEKLPWPLSFSYGRGIQRPALAIWASDMKAIKNAQGALLERAKANAEASLGTYSR